jgi:hypothetical protein
MSATRHATAEEAEADDDQLDGLDRADLVASVERLAAENERLRASYLRARRSQYRRTAAGFAALGLAATGGAVAFPGVRSVLLAFGGTGLFAALLVLFLTPERFVSASVSDTVFATLADVEQHLVSELELQTEAVYVPTVSRPETNARLFVPQHVDYAIPDAERLGELFVTSAVEAEQGVSLPPTGDRLYTEFERTLSGELGDDAGAIATQLTAALTEQFELVDDTTIEVGGEQQHASIAIDNPAFGELHQLDHPVVSLLAVGFATGLDRPVTVETRDDDRFNAVVTVSWDTAAEQSPSQPGDAQTETTTPTA